jgi:hypothetical protein
VYSTNPVLHLYISCYVTVNKPVLSYLLLCLLLQVFRYFSLGFLNSLQAQALFAMLKPPPKVGGEDLLGDGYHHPVSHGSESLLDLGLASQFLIYVGKEEVVCGGQFTGIEKTALNELEALGHRSASHFIGWWGGGGGIPGRVTTGPITANWLIGTGDRLK